LKNNGLQITKAGSCGIIRKTGNCSFEAMVAARHDNSPMGVA